MNIHTTLCTPAAAPKVKPSPFNPHDERPVVLFVGRAGGRLMDNVKYMFLEAATHDYGFAPVFLTTFRDEFDRISAFSLPVLMVQHCTAELLAKAKFAVLDDFTDKSGPAVQAALLSIPKLQLWHGIPLKKIGFPEIDSPVNMHDGKRLHLTMQYSGYACVASTSQWTTEELFSKVFKADDVQALGYPRNDVLLRPLQPLDMIHTDRDLFTQVKAHKRAGGKVAVYMPTFRDTGGDFLSDGSLDLMLLSALCVKHNILFIAKFHPYVAAEAFKDLPGFILCQSSVDMYPFLPLADALVTDYSSIYFDWLLLQKPTLFFAYDKEKYISKDRDLFFAYESMTPGPISASGAQFLDDFLQTLVYAKDDFALARKELAQKLFDVQDAGASARWCHYVQQQLR